MRYWRRKRRGRKRFVSDRKNIVLGTKKPPSSREAARWSCDTGSRRQENASIKRLTIPPNFDRLIPGNTYPIWDIDFRLS